MQNTSSDYCIFMHSGSVEEDKVYTNYYASVHERDTVAYTGN